MSEENKAIVGRAIEEIWNKGNSNIIGEILSAGFVSHHPRNRDEDVHGVEAYKNRVDKIHEACAGIKVDVLKLFGEGDQVMCHVRGEATFRGNPGDTTGKQITTTATAVRRQLYSELRWNRACRRRRGGHCNHSS